MVSEHFLRNDIYKTALMHYGFLARELQYLPVNLVFAAKKLMKGLYSANTALLNEVAKWRLSQSDLKNLMAKAVYIHWTLFRS